MLTQEQTNAARLAQKFVDRRWCDELRRATGPRLAEALIEGAELEALWLDLAGERRKAFTEAFALVAYTEVLRRTGGVS